MKLLKFTHVLLRLAMVPQDTSHEHLDSRPHAERGAGLVSRDFISSLSAEAGFVDGKMMRTFPGTHLALFVARFVESEKETALTGAVFC